MVETAAKYYAYTSPVDAFLSFNLFSISFLEMAIFLHIQPNWTPDWRLLETYPSQTPSSPPSGCPISVIAIVFPFLSIPIAAAT